MKQIVVNIGDRAADDLLDLCKAAGRSPNWMIGRALKLLMLHEEAVQSGGCLMFCDYTGAMGQIALEPLMNPDMTPGTHGV
jgi:hypothetical protein